MRSWIGVSRHGAVYVPVAVGIARSQEQLDGLTCEIAAYLTGWWFPKLVGRVDGIEVPSQDVGAISLSLEHIQNRLHLRHSPSRTGLRAAVDQVGGKQQYH